MCKFLLGILYFGSLRKSRGKANIWLFKSYLPHQKMLKTLGFQKFFWVLHLEVGILQALSDHEMACSHLSNLFDQAVLWLNTYQNQSQTVQKAKNNYKWFAYLLKVWSCLRHTFFAHKIANYKFNFPKDSFDSTELSVIFRTIQYRLAYWIWLSLVCSTA